MGMQVQFAVGRHSLTCPTDVYSRHAGSVYLYEALPHIFLRLPSVSRVLTYFPDSYKGGGVGLHMWNVTPELFNTYQKVQCLKNPLNAFPLTYHAS